MENANRHLPPADRAAAVHISGFRRMQAYLAVPVAVVMVFPFLREKFQCSVKLVRIMIFERRRNSRIAHFRIEKIRFPCEIRRGMRV